VYREKISTFWKNLNKYFSFVPDCCWRCQCQLHKHCVNIYCPKMYVTEATGRSVSFYVHVTQLFAQNSFAWHAVISPCNLHTECGINVPIVNSFRSIWKHMEPSLGLARILVLYAIWILKCLSFSRNCLPTLLGNIIPLC
jgi:hypothetical protein